MLIASLITVQIIIFAGLLFFFRRILTRNVIQATRHLDELNQDYTRKEKEVNRLLSEAKQQSQKMVEGAREEAEKVKSQIIKETEAERDKTLKQARKQSDEIIQQADKSRQALISELNERIQKEAINKACELIHGTLPERFKQDVHSHWIEELIESSFNELKNLQVSEEIKEAKITSAFPLTEQQKEDITKRIEALLGRKMLLKEEVDSKIVAGIIVTIGSLVLDGSLKNKIQAQARDIDIAEKT